MALAITGKPSEAVLSRSGTAVSGGGGKRACGNAKDLGQMGIKESPLSGGIWDGLDRHRSMRKSIAEVR